MRTPLQLSVEWYHWGRSNHSCVDFTHAQLIMTAGVSTHTSVISNFPTKPPPFLKTYADVSTDFHYFKFHTIFQPSKQFFTHTHTHTHTRTHTHPHFRYFKFQAQTATFSIHKPRCFLHSHSTEKTAHFQFIVNLIQICNNRHFFQFRRQVFSHCHSTEKPPISAHCNP